MLIERFCIDFEHYDLSCLNRINKYFAKKAYDHDRRNNEKYKTKILNEKIRLKEERKKEKCVDGYKTGYESDELTCRKTVSFRAENLPNDWKQKTWYFKNVGDYENFVFKLYELSYLYCRLNNETAICVFANADAVHAMQGRLSHEAGIGKGIVTDNNLEEILTLCPVNKGKINLRNHDVDFNPSICKVLSNHNFNLGIPNKHNYCFLIVIIQLWTFCPHDESIINSLLNAVISNCANQLNIKVEEFKGEIIDKFSIKFENTEQNVSCSNSLYQSDKIDISTLTCDISDVFELAKILQDLINRNFENLVDLDLLYTFLYQTYEAHRTEHDDFLLNIKLIFQKVTIAFDNQVECQNKIGEVFFSTPNQLDIYCENDCFHENPANFPLY